MDISRLIGARLKAVRRKAARLKSARLKAVMELLPVRRIIFFFIRGPIHIPKLTHILKPKPKFVRTTNCSPELSLFIQMTWRSPWVAM